METAIIFPLLFAITFGLFEFGLLYKDLHLLTEASRAGARIGSTLSRDPAYADVTVEEVAGELIGLFDESRLDLLVVFNADPDTGEPVSGDDLHSCTTDCGRYLWDSANDEWDLIAGTGWDYTDQEACGRPFDNDYLGVFVEGTHEWVTGMFGDSKTISGKAVFRLEPVTTTEACK